MASERIECRVPDSSFVQVWMICRLGTSKLVSLPNFILSFMFLFFLVKLTSGGFACARSATILFAEYVHAHGYFTPGVAATRAFLAATGKDLVFDFEARAGVQYLVSFGRVTPHGTRAVPRPSFKP
jgi:hypothetical protein